MAKSQLLLAAALGLLYASIAQATTITYTAVLDGASESPPTASPATGVALVTYKDLTHLMTVDATFTDLLAPITTAAVAVCRDADGKRRPCKVGYITEKGGNALVTPLPTLTGFPSGTTSGSYVHVFDLTLFASWNPAFVTASGGIAGAEAELAQALMGGGAYFEIQTSAFPGGEILGILEPVAAPEPATLSLLGLGLVGFVMTRRARLRGFFGFRFD